MPLILLKGACKCGNSLQESTSIRAQLRFITESDRVNTQNQERHFGKTQGESPVQIIRFNICGVSSRGIAQLSVSTL